MLDVKSEVLAAEKRIREYIRQTSLEYSIRFSDKTGCQVYLKCENLQYTNAFKVRGALNKLLALNSAEKKQGVVTASSGNHGSAVAFGLHQLEMQGIVFVPKTASTAKVEAIQGYHVPVEFYGEDTLDTENYAQSYAKDNKMVYVSPYNDPFVLGGQGTIAVELLAQLQKIDVVFVPVGGGGLISGIAGYLKELSPNTTIIGCQPKNSAVMAESIKAGRIIEMKSEPTLSDATAGGIEKDSITFEICQKYVDDFILVTEDEIKSAIILLLKTNYMLIEGAAAVALAAFINSASQFQNKNLVVILSGSKISVDTLKKILC